MVPRAWTFRRVTSRLIRLFKWHLNVDIELILVLLVVWIAIGDISLRAAMLPPMDVFAWPQPDAIPPGYNGIQATHLLTVRAALAIVDSFIAVVTGLLIITWFAEAYFSHAKPFRFRRPVFRTVAAVVTIMAGVVVTSRRGMCLKPRRLGCVPHGLLDEDIAAFGSSWLDGAIFDKPVRLLHFVEGRWAPWPLGDGLSQTQKGTFPMGYTATFVLIIAPLYRLSEASAEDVFAQHHHGPRVLIMRFAVRAACVVLLAIVPYVGGILYMMFGLGFLSGGVYILRLCSNIRSVLGMSPNVSLQELDQILAVVVGGITALISIVASLTAFTRILREGRGMLGEGDEDLHTRDMARRHSF